MKFSTRAEYGLKAMVNLARCYPEQKNIKAICREENISIKYLERLVGEMRKNNLVTSQVGKSGGYVLAKKPTLIKVGEIIETLDGPIAPMRCVGKKCINEKKCSSFGLWNKLGGQIKKTLYGIKLSELI